jgi:hypothetical protein
MFTIGTQSSTGLAIINDIWMEIKCVFLPSAYEHSYVQLNSERSTVPNHVFGPQSFSSLFLRKHRFSCRFLIDICSYGVDQVLMNGSRTARNRDVSVYPSFLQILIPPSIFPILFILFESYIFFWTIFSALVLQLKLHIEVYGLSWLTSLL